MTESARPSEGIKSQVSAAWMHFRGGWDVFGDHVMLDCKLCGWDWTDDDDTGTLADMVNAAREHYEEAHGD